MPGSAKGRDVKASRPKWPRGKNFGLGLGLVTPGLGLGLGTLWLRPQAVGLGLELQYLTLRNLVSLAFGIPPNCHQKRNAQHCLVIYRAASQNRNFSYEPSKQLSRYIILINSDSFDSTAESSALSKLYSDFAVLQPLFQRLFCVPASSAPVESLLSEWTYHVFIPTTHVKCCARMPCFFLM